jgi:hypothetical protein
MFHGNECPFHLSLPHDLRGSGALRKYINPAYSAVQAIKQLAPSSILRTTQSISCLIMALFRFVALIAIVLAAFAAMASGKPLRHHRVHAYGDICPVGAQFCDEDDPTIYRTCAPDGWKIMSCPDGTVCRNNYPPVWPPKIVCDWPGL